MSSEEQENQTALITYFWQETHDLERWIDWDSVKVNYPEVEKAWLEYKESIHKLNRIVSSL